MSFSSITSLAAVSTLGVGSSAASFGDAASRAISGTISRVAGDLTSSMRDLEGSLSLVQTADAGAEDIADLLEEMRDSATQATDDSLTADERSELEAELSDLADQLDDIAESTSYSGRDLLDGSTASLTFLVGEQHAVGAELEVAFGDLGAEALGVDTLSLEDEWDAADALIQIDRALQTVDEYRAGFAAVSSEMASAYLTREAQLQALSPMEAVELAQETSSQILQSLGDGLVAQTHNLSPSAALLV